MIKINYDEATHTYTNAETNETLISVTQIDVCNIYNIW